MHEQVKECVRIILFAQNELLNRALQVGMLVSYLRKSSQERALAHADRPDDQYGQSGVLGRGQDLLKGGHFLLAPENGAVVRENAGRYLSTVSS